MKKKTILIKNKENKFIVPTKKDFNFFKKFVKLKSFQNGGCARPEEV